jgi:hypothetical protein
LIIEDKAMETAIRLTWTEIRFRESAPEPFFIIADLVGRRWTLAERSTWEDRWYECPLNPDRRAIVKRSLRSALLDGAGVCHVSLTIRGRGRRAAVRRFNVHCSVISSAGGRAAVTGA